MLPQQEKHDTISLVKTNIHPTYFPHAKIKCACGNVISVGSAKENIEVEICSNCHPFFTGKGKLIDTSGRVEKFKARQAKKQEPKTKKPARREKVAE